MDQMELAMKRDEAVKLVMLLCSHLSSWHPVLVDEARQLADRIVDPATNKFDTVFLKGLNGAESGTAKPERNIERI